MAAPQAVPQAKILVVDTQDHNITLLEELLVPYGYTVCKACSSEQAFEAVRQQQPDLILLDVLMPGIDGFTVCKTLKDDPETRLIPIIIMTALGQVEDRIKGIEAGADDFLTTPVNRDELMARIRTSLRMKHAIERKIAGLVEVNYLLAQTVDTDDMLKVLLESANRLFSTEGTSIAFIDEGKETLTFSTVVGGAPLGQNQIQMSQGIVGWVARMNRGVVCNDVTHDPRFYAGMDRQTGFQTKSILCAPIVQENEVIGAIEAVNTANPEGFSQEDLQLLMALGGLAAAAMNRVRAFSAVNNARAVYEEVVQDRYRLVVGNSSAMQDVLRLAKTVAVTPATVLLLGESGTGKEVMARAIHQWSERADQPFVAVNCTALTPALLESELFGHERGAFTGAVAQKKGKFELAEGGTLFLDEIGDLAQDLQVKLLRVLQEKEFQRVGGTKDIRTDARILAATNRDLRQAVQDGSFREDVYYRLNVVSLTLPPLRERPEDIAILAQHFVDRFGQEVKRTRMHLHRDVLPCLQSYTWPGNVRELQNAIERAVVLAPGQEITSAELPTEVRYANPSAAGIEEKDGDLELGSAPLAVRPMAEAVDAYQRGLIRRALELCHDNQTEAAKLLKVPQPSLSRLMKRLGLR